jgi:hypothetical protein
VCQGAIGRCAINAAMRWRWLSSYCVCWARLRRTVQAGQYRRRAGMTGTPHCSHRRGAGESGVGSVMVLRAAVGSALPLHVVLREALQLGLAVLLQLPLPQSVSSVARCHQPQGRSRLLRSRV